MSNIGFHFGIACLARLALGCGSLSKKAAESRANIHDKPPAEPTRQTDQALLRAAQGRKSNYVRDLEMLVNIDSGTDDASVLPQVSDFLMLRLKNLGATVKILPATPAAGRMVHGTFQETGTKDIMLLAHSDTVFGKGEAARRLFKVVGNKAFAPSVADAKGGVAIILHALKITGQQGFKDYKTLTALLNPDEEKSSLGSRDTIRTLSARQDYLLSYKPPDGERVIVATNRYRLRKAHREGPGFPCRRRAGEGP